MNLSSSSSSLPFVASKTPSYLEIINILRTEPENTVTIVAIGPLMNLAKAAEIDPYVFSRAKSVVSMGGALRVPGNVTPYSEFNVFSDPLAASRVYNLTGTLDRSPQNKSLPITLDILPLDLTEKHKMFAQDFDKVQEFHSTNPSPLFNGQVSGSNKLSILTNTFLGLTILHNTWPHSEFKCMIHWLSTMR